MRAISSNRVGSYIEQLRRHHQQYFSAYLYFIGDEFVVIRSNSSRADTLGDDGLIGCYNRHATDKQIKDDVQFHHRNLKG